MSHVQDMDEVMQDFFRITKVPHDPFAKEFLNRCQSHTVKANGRFYKYYQCGSGPTVVLVHGIHSNLGSMVAIAEDLLEQKYKVVLFDAPAHGEALGSATNPVEVREVIRNICSRLGEIHAVVCHSLGGLWALAAWNSDFHAKTIVSIASPSSKTFLVDKFAELNHINDDVAQAVIAELESRFGDNVWVEFSPVEIVKSINVPGLIIHGENDDYVPPDHAEQLHSNWRESTVEMIEGAGHFDIVGSPKVKQIISTYLQDIR